MLRINKKSLRASKTGSLVRLFSFAMAMCLLAGCSSGSEEKEPVLSSPAAESSVGKASYETCVAEIGTCTRTLSSGAKLIYPNTQALTFEGENARYLSGNVHVGDEVKKGDVLAVFTVESSAADLKAQRLSVEQTKKSYAQGVASREEAIRLAQKAAAEGSTADKLKVQELQAELQLYKLQNQASIDEQEKKLAEMEEKITNTALTAPFDGIISEVNPLLRKGVAVNGQMVVTMYSTSPAYIAVTDTTHSLRIGMEVTVTAGRNNRREDFKGYVVSAPEGLPAAMNESTYYIKVPDAPLESLELTPTISAEVAVAKDVVIVSRRAVFTEDGRNYVRILEDGVVHKRYVEVGWDDLRTCIWIVKGVEAGQTLILE